MKFEFFKILVEDINKLDLYVWEMVTLGRIFLFLAAPEC
jgi:hypothetical protein